MATKNPSCLSVAFHFLLTLLTGGIWLIILIIWHILKKK